MIGQYVHLLAGWPVDYQDHSGAVMKQYLRKKLTKCLDFRLLE